MRIFPSAGLDRAPFILIDPSNNHRWPFHVASILFMFFSSLPMLRAVSYGSTGFCLSVSSCCTTQAPVTLFQLAAPREHVVDGGLQTRRQRRSFRRRTPFREPHPDSHNAVGGNLSRNRSLNNPVKANPGIRPSPHLEHIGYLLPPCMLYRRHQMRDDPG
jgi:hypothetical protein